MSAPELPDIFGNYVLGEDFVEIVSPQAISWIPQTTGWWWLGGLALLLLLRHTWKKLHLWYRNRYRREALKKMASMTIEADHAHWLPELNRLLKLTALAGYPRAEVAHLSGSDWARFLNRQCLAPPFSKYQEEVLSEGTYTGLVLSNEARDQLLAACDLWVRTHVGQHDV